MRHLIQVAFLISFLFSTAFPNTNAMAEVQDKTPLYGQLLQQYVKDGVIDYMGFKKDEAQLDIYLNYLVKTIPERMKNKERFALYINVYNAYTIKLILANFEDAKPPASIKDIGSFFSKPWSIKFVNVGGKIYTLDNIENDILRPTFKDARIHFAVNCASKSCPPLISVPYSGTNLDQQLNDNTIAFINNERENRLIGNTLHISPIFKWFKEDFHNNPIDFFKQYSKGNLKKNLALKRTRSR